MPGFLDDLRLLPGRNKLNVYALLIAKLTCYPATSPHDQSMIRALIMDLKILFHNHEQQFSVLRFILLSTLSEHNKISPNLTRFISNIITEIRDREFQHYFCFSEVTSVDLECRIGRFFESQLAVNLLLDPSPKTWACVNKVSEKIIDLISAVGDPTIFNNFLEDLGPDPETENIPFLPLAFGRYEIPPTLSDVLETLKAQTELNRIMLIQFMFMRDAYCLLDIVPSSQEKTIRFGYGGEFAKYTEKISSEDIRPFFWSYPAFNLYKDRGRGPFLPHTSKELGICINPEDRAKFPSAPATWYPDCICQRADLDSPYTQSLVRQDIPYVAGPSGMTTLLSSAMLLLGQFDSKEEHHHYILAIASFITGGGLHSLHEVLTVPRVRLGLLKSYKAYGDKAGNYHSFFELFSMDEKFNYNLNKAWKSTINWLCELFPDLTTKSSFVMNRPLSTARPLKEERKTCIIM